MSAALLQIKAGDSGAAVKVPPLLQVAQADSHPPGRPALVYCNTVPEDSRSRTMLTFVLIVGCWHASESGV